jgi:hypothetical protein
MSDAPPFDPTKPFTRATPQAPAFDPSKPFTKAPAQPGSKPEARSAISSALSGKDLPGEPAAGGESLSVIDRLWRGLQGKDTSVPGKVAMGMGDPAYGAAQLGARGLRAVGGPDLGVDKAVQERESRYESGRQAELKPGEKLAADWNRLLGNVASPVNLAIGGGLGAAAKGVGLAGRLGAAALGGAAGGATAPVTDPKADYWTEKAKQTGIGAAGGLAMGGAGEAVGAAIAPRMGADAAKLASQGVQMTPGQMARGPAGVAKGMEDRLSGFPVLGDFIRNARRRSVGSFNEATINQALEPIGAKLPAGVKPGNEAVKAAGDAISQAYNKTLGQIPTVVVDRDLQNALKAVQLDAQQRPAVWKNLKGELSRVQNSLKRGNFTGREAQLAGSELERVARGLQTSDNFFEREVSKHLREVRSSLFDAIERQYPALAPDLQNANASWAMLTRVENAAGRRAASGGVFTPMDLLTAVKSGSGGVRRREFSRGDALFQDWAQTAQRVLPSEIPDSGTAGRLLAEHPLSATAFGLATSPLDLLYTKTGGRAVQGLMSPGPGRQAAGAGAARSGAIAAPGAGTEAARKKPRPSVVGP